MKPPSRGDRGSPFELLPILADEFHFELPGQGYIEGVAATDLLFGGDFRGSGRESFGDGEELDQVPSPEQVDRLSGEIRIAETAAERGGHFGEKNHGGDDRLVLALPLRQPAATCRMTGIGRMEERHTGAGVDDRHAYRRCSSVSSRAVFGERQDRAICSARVSSLWSASSRCAWRKSPSLS